MFKTIILSSVVAVTFGSSAALAQHSAHGLRHINARSYVALSPRRSPAAERFIGQVDRSSLGGPSGGVGQGG